MASPSTARNAVIYQIDFTAVASGKRIASSKRRVRWRFGFANPAALEAGATGTDCRGEEHDVTLVWSITSGKRLVLADGQEVHYSTSRNSIFDFSWTMRGNHILKIVAHASPPLSPVPGFRQYDFFIDGRSFFTMPKVYRLGLAPNDPRALSPSTSPRLAERGQRYPSERSSGNIANLEAPHNEDEVRDALMENGDKATLTQMLFSQEEAYLQEAIRQSLEDDGPQAKTNGTGGRDGEVDLLGFGGPAAAPASPFDQALVPTAPTQTYAMASSATGAPTLLWAPETSSEATAVTDTGSYTGGYAVATPAPAEQAPYSYGVPYGGQMPPQTAYTAQDAFAAPPQQQQSYAAPIGSASWGAPAPAQAPVPYGTAASWNAPASAPFDAAGAWNAPAPIATNSFAADVPPAVTPHTQQTPSSLGFNSPAPDFAGFSPVPGEVTSPEEQETPDETLELNVNGTTKSADDAYAKLFNMDTFSLASKNDAPRSNPFEFAPVGATESLADIKAKKANVSILEWLC